MNATAFVALPSTPKPKMGKEVLPKCIRRDMSCIMKLTQEEKSLLDSVEKGEWKRIPDFRQEAARYNEAARATLRKDKRVNIRMAERDLIRFQKTALQEGLPYQTLLSSILHKYINGRLVEKTG